ncbi:MAG: hypothetical protein ACRDJ4_00060 [Actinomycetota bacterium]
MLPSTERPAVAWRTLSLKEFRRPPSEPSLFERDGEGLGSLSIPALALAHAAREADFDGYHEAVFDPVGAAHLPRRPPRACCPGRRRPRTKPIPPGGSRPSRQNTAGWSGGRPLGTPTLLFDDARAPCACGCNPPRTTPVSDGI